MLHPLRVTQQYWLASVAARLSSTGISHHNLFPHIPSVSLSTLNSSPHLGIAPQFLNSSSQPLRHLGYVWLQQGLSDSHSIQAPTDQLFRSVAQICLLTDLSRQVPRCGDQTPPSVPPPTEGGPVLLTFLFSPQFLHPTEFCGASIYSFLLVRYSCPLSAGVLHVLLCLKVYS